MVFEHDYVNFPELTKKQLETLQFTSPHKQIVEDFEAEVVKVSDGDTIRLQTDFRDFTFPLRFLGTDAPELNEGGQEAKEWLTQRLENKKVSILININNRVGKFGRLLGRVVHGGMDVGDEMLTLGLVTTFEDRRADQLPNLSKMFDLKQWFT